MTPVGLAFFRGATKATKLGGYDIPKGSVILLNTYGVHHSTSVWPHPEKFDPSRWEDPSTGTGFRYTPFGGGARRCIGLPSAMVEMKGILALLLKHFTFTLCEDLPLKAEVKISYAPRRIYFKINKRN
ncbi:cytochrome P450 3A2-like [Nematostella vectensis]|uniref:cytochrome P450 3A2-like n=1 Tax=Nematostella vectensis TaxID=45351 RepID=UPI002076F4BB|nr:cytochrome P450 3A2-like [Nematostella vectensis]